LRFSSKEDIAEDLLRESMAAPKRRTQRSARTTARIAARNAGTGMNVTTTTTRAGAAAATLDSEEARAGRMMDFQVEMNYINHDLRELLIISVCLFALLFLVGFFI